MGHYITHCLKNNWQRWSRGHKARGQGQGQGQPFRGQTLSRPRTGMLEAKAKDQGHKAQVLSKKKKKKRSSQKFFRRSPKKKKKKKKRSSQKFFKRSPRKNAFQKIFQPLHKILIFQKIVLSSSRGQANFRGLEASRPRPRTWPSRPRPRPRTSKSVLEDVLEAKDVLEGSTSDNWAIESKLSNKVLNLWNVSSNWIAKSSIVSLVHCTIDVKFHFARYWFKYSKILVKPQPKL